jgi:hypothetical protein
MTIELAKSDSLGRPFGKLGDFNHDLAFASARIGDSIALIIGSRSDETLW